MARPAGKRVAQSPMLDKENLVNTKHSKSNMHTYKTPATTRRKRRVRFSPDTNTPPPPGSSKVLCRHFQQLAVSPRPNLQSGPVRVQSCGKQQKQQRTPPGTSHVYQQRLQELAVTPKRPMLSSGPRRRVVHPPSTASKSPTRMGYDGTHQTPSRQLLKSTACSRSQQVSHNHDERTGAYNKTPVRKPLASKPDPSSHVSPKFVVVHENADTREQPPSKTPMRKTARSHSKHNHASHVSFKSVAHDTDTRRDGPPNKTPMPSKGRNHLKPDPSSHVSPKAPIVQDSDTRDGPPPSETPVRKQHVDTKERPPSKTPMWKPLKTNSHSKIKHTSHVSPTIVPQNVVDTRDGSPSTTPTRKASKPSHLSSRPAVQDIVDTSLDTVFAEGVHLHSPRYWDAIREECSDPVASTLMNAQTPSSPIQKVSSSLLDVMDQDKMAMLVRPVPKVAHAPLH